MSGIGFESNDAMFARAESVDQQDTVEIVSGVEGPCLVVNDRRVAGPKPWGGGMVVQTFKVKRSDLLAALKEAS